MKPLKMVFRSQIEPSIKSYEHFDFFEHFLEKSTKHHGSGTPKPTKKKGGLGVEVRG